MDVTSYYDGYKYTLHFKKGENVTESEGKLLKEPCDRKKTGTIHYWRPDIEVFTNIDIPLEYYLDTLKKQAVVNTGIRFLLRDQQENGKFNITEFI